MTSRSGSAFIAAEAGCQQYESVSGVLKGIEAWRQNQRTSLFDCLYRLFNGDVRSYVRRHGGTDEDAWDVFQDFTAEFLQRIEENKLSFAGYEGPFGAVVMRGAKFIWLRRFRKAEYRTTTVGLPAEDWGLPSEVDLGDVLEREAEARALKNAIATLNGDHRTFIELFYGQGKTYYEIAELTGQNAASLKSNRYRIMEKLKTAFNSFL